MPYRSVTSVCKGPIKEWVHRHGPHVHGRNVDDNEVREILTKFGIIKRHSSPHHSRGDGDAVKSIQIVECMMR